HQSGVRMVHLRRAGLLLLALGTAAPLAAQQRQMTTVIVSIEVVGVRRVSPATVIAELGIVPGRPTTYRDLQRGLEALFSTGNYADIQVSQGTVDGREVLRLEVVERPLLTSWTVRGAQAFTERSLRSRVQLLEGRAYDPAAARRS